MARPFSSAVDSFELQPEGSADGGKELARYAAPQFVTMSSVSGTTLTAAAFVNGMERCWVRIENGNALGQWRKIVSVSNGVSATVDKALSSTTGVTLCSLWNQAAAFRSTAAGSATTTVSSEVDANFAADTLDDCTLVDLAAAATALVSDYAVAAGAGTFTHASWGASGANRAYLVVYPVTAKGDTQFTIESTPIKRQAAFGDFRRIEAVPGPTRWSGQVPVPFVGLATATADSATAAVPARELNVLLTRQMNRVLDAGSQVVAGTASAPTITTGTHERFSGTAATALGTLVLIEGEVRAITAKTDGGVGADTLTLDSALSQAAAAAAVVRGGANWQRNLAQQSMEAISMRAWRGDGWFQQGFCGMWNATLRGGARDAYPEWLFALQGGAAAQYDYARPYTVPAISTKVPHGSAQSIVRLGGTTHDVNDYSVDLGFSVQRAEQVTGAEGMGVPLVVAGDPMYTFTLWLDRSKFNEWERAGLVQSVLLQIGSAPTRCCAVYSHRCQIQGAVIGESNGGYTVQVQAFALDSQLINMPDLVLTQF